MAFNRVHHSILLHKLWSVGLGQSSLEWVKSYLDGQSIITAVEHVLSSPQPVTSGVSQGSVLGPLLFVLYVSDLPRSVSSSSCDMFADDSLLHNSFCSAAISHKLPCCALQADADKAQVWADEWGSTFNASKSSHMIIHRPSQSLSWQPTSCFMVQSFLWFRPRDILVYLCHLP